MTDIFLSGGGCSLHGLEKGLRMKRFFQVFDAIVHTFCIGALWMLVVVMCVQVFFRYVLRDALSWPEEVGRFAFGWCAMLGVAMCMGRNKHLRLDVLQLVLPERVWACLLRISALVGLGFFLFFAWLSWPSMMSIWEQGILGASVPWPQWIIWASIPVGCVLTAVYAFRNCFLKGSGQKEE